LIGVGNSSPTGATLSPEGNASEFNIGKSASALTLIKKRLMLAHSQNSISILNAALTLLASGKYTRDQIQMAILGIQLELSEAMELYQQFTQASKRIE